MTNISQTSRAVTTVIKEKFVAAAVFIKKVVKIAIAILLYPIRQLQRRIFKYRTKKNEPIPLDRLKRTLSDFQTAHTIDSTLDLSVHLEFMVENCPETLSSLQKMLSDPKESPEHKCERYTFLKYAIDLLAVIGIDVNDDTNLNLCLIEPPTSASNMDLYALTDCVQRVINRVDIPPSMWTKIQLTYPENTNIEHVLQRYSHTITQQSEQKEWRLCMQYGKLLYILQERKEYTPLQKLGEHLSSHYKDLCFSVENVWEYALSLPVSDEEDRTFKKHMANIQAKIDSEK